MPASSARRSWEKPLERRKVFNRAANLSITWASKSKCKNPLLLIMSLQNISNNPDIWIMPPDLPIPTQLSPVPPPPPVVSGSHPSKSGQAWNSQIPPPPPHYPMPYQRMDQRNATTAQSGLWQQTSEFRQFCLVMAGLFGVVFVFLLVIVAAVGGKANGKVEHAEASSSTSVPPANTDSATPISRKNRLPASGREAEIRIGEPGSVAYATVSEGAYNQLLSSIVRNDEAGLTELALAGQLFILKEGTRVLVLDAGFSSTKVRVRSGNYQGQIAYITTDVLDGQ